MTMREYRRMANTIEEQDRLARRACPACGCERENFQPRNRSAVCCKPSCSAEYWQGHHQTRNGMRTLIFNEQVGLCASCKQKIEMLNAHEGLYGTHPYIMDHIRPIAMEGSMWDRENLQVLCKRCNKEKTARDMGRIATWKKHHSRSAVVPEDRSQQLSLFVS